MLARAGVKPPNRCRKRTARASLWAKAWLPTTSRSATCAAVSPKTAALRLSQARAAARASAGSSEVAAPSEPSAGRIEAGRPELVPADVDGTESGGRLSLAGGGARCRAGRGRRAPRSGSASVVAVRPAEPGAALAVRAGRPASPGTRAAVSRASAVAVSRPRRRGVGVMTVTTARSAVRYAPPSTGAKTGLRIPTRAFCWIDPRIRLPSSRASDWTIHSPARPPPGAERPERPGRQPALVLAPGDAGRLRSRGPQGMGGDRAGPGQAPRRRRPGPARGGGRRRDLPRDARRGTGRPRGLTGDRWFQRRQAAEVPGRSRTSPRSSASPRCCRSTPAASASSPVTTSRRRATSACRSSAWACSPARLLPAGAVPRGLAAGDLPGPRPRRPADLDAPRGRWHARHDLHRDARWTRPDRADLGRQRRPRAAAHAGHRRRGQPRALRRRDRPSVRRQQQHRMREEAPPRRRRRARAAGLLPHHRQPGARGLPHQRGRRLPRPGADPRADRGRERSRGSTSTPPSRSAARPPSSPPTRRSRPASTASRGPWSSSTSARVAPPPASPSTASWSSAPRTTRAATPRSSTWPSWASGSRSAPAGSRAAR